MVTTDCDSSTVLWPSNCDWSEILKHSLAIELISFSMKWKVKHKQVYFVSIVLLVSQAMQVLLFDAFSWLIAHRTPMILLILRMFGHFWHTLCIMLVRFSKQGRTCCYVKLFYEWYTKPWNTKYIWLMWFYFQGFLKTYWTTGWLSLKKMTSINIYGYQNKTEPMRMKLIPNINRRSNHEVHLCYGNKDEEYVLCYKSWPFCILSSSSLPTPNGSYIDYLLVRKLFCCGGVKIRLLGKIPVIVQSVKDGRTSGNLHLTANVVDNLYQHFETHCVAGKKTNEILTGGKGICT